MPRRAGAILAVSNAELSVSFYLVEIGQPA